MIKIPKLFEDRIKKTTDDVSFANESLQRNITIWLDENLKVIFKSSVEVEIEN